MRKIFLVIALLSCFFLTGCSILPRVTFDKPGVTPQVTEKSNNNESCAGEYTTNSNGEIVTCSKGYRHIETNYKQAERKYTIAETVANFIRGLAGWGFWGLVLIVVLFPSTIGFLIGRVFNIFRSALTGTIKAISDFRKKVPTVVLNNVEVPDPTYVKAVDALLDALEVEHSKDVNIMKTISKIRLQLKIEDTD